MKHNQKISQILKDIEKKTEAATSHPELVEAMRPAFDMGNDFNYKHKTEWQILLATSLFTFYVWFTYWSPDARDEIYGYGANYHVEDPMSYVGMVTAIITVFIPLLILFRHGLMSRVSNKIAKADALLDHNIDPSGAGLSELKSVQKSFREFSRGNHSRRFTKAYKTNAHAEQPFTVYTFEYVDKRTEVTTDSKGRTQTKTVYTTYYRYGLMLQFDYYKSIAIGRALVSGGRKAQYEPASIEFNRLFKMRCADDTQLSRFLKPAVVEAFIDFKNTLQSLNVEINADGLMCISFGDQDIVTPKTQHRLNKPALFFEELQGTNKLPKLTAVLHFYKTLTRHSDNNFKAPKTDQSLEKEIAQ
ncbi:hypothetical protein [Vibrio sp. Hal054]|uniref:hypothetical protein n=1 Tax=Vibrio sp. Hal054 TaxID=3035158 RepID=UPI00301B8D94